MGKNKRVSAKKVDCMIKMRSSGMTQSMISINTGVSRSSVQKCLARYGATGSCSWRKAPGKTRVTSFRTDWFIKRAATINPTISSSEIKAQLPQDVTAVSTRTIRRRLQEDMGLRSYRPACTPKLSKKNIVDRLAFARRCKHWTSERWHSVLFSDETILK